jgi:dynein heavy chain
MNTVLQQEVIRFNKLIKVIHSSLGELVRALQGLVVMSADLDAAANAMFLNQVPAIWTSKAYVVKTTTPVNSRCIENNNNSR